MIILEKEVERYNNILTLATKDMMFCKNANVNYSKPKVIPEASPKASPQTSPNPIPYLDRRHQSHSIKAIESIASRVEDLSNNLVYILGVMFVGGFVVSKYILI
jgi:hypothetical protein